MSQLLKVLQVLDLFSAEQPTLGAEQIATQLDISRPTAFRYVRQLCDAGLLLNLAGSYALGPRIIELDHCIRASDPILAHCRDALRTLSGTQACTAVLVTMYGEKVIHVHSESAAGAAGLHYSRGRTLPLLRGAASKVILAHQPPGRLKRIFQSHASEAQALGLGASASAFVKFFRQVRQQGHYISCSEVEAQITGVAAPIFLPSGEVTSCLSLTFDHRLHPDYAAAHFVPLVRGCAHDVSLRIARAAGGRPGARGLQQGS